MSWAFWYALGGLLAGLHFARGMRLTDCGGDPSCETTRRAYVGAMLFCMAAWPAIYVTALTLAVVEAMARRR